MPNPKILIIEDANDVADLLRRGLTEEGFDVTVASTGREALARADEYWNLILLDLTLPDVPGEFILDYLNQKPDHPAVLVLTAIGGLDEKIKLFRKGCDDYLTKPFAFEELTSRIRALLRRPTALPQKLRYEDLILDPDHFTLSCPDKKVTLTPKEFALCRHLMSDPGRVFTRRELLHSVWGFTNESQTNYIDVHVNHLRKKLSEINHDSWLRTIRGSGLTFQSTLENRELITTDDTISI